MSGSFDSQAENDPGVPAMSAAIVAGLAGSMAANTASQAEAARFISENGADVVGGHAPVNSPTGSFLEAGSGSTYDAGS